MSELQPRSLLSSAGIKLVRASTPLDEGHDNCAKSEESRPPLFAASKRQDPSTSSRACSACLVEFLNREHQVQHYKLDWHRLNIKKKLRGLLPVAEDEFEKISGDVSSISGSGSENSSDSEQESYGRPSPVFHQIASRQYFITTDKSVFSVYKCALNQISPHNFEISDCPMWIIVMLSGGHFAGAVFERDQVIKHKTFHRYTVRAKRGTAQSARDSQQGGNQPKSAGASLRRYNEAALSEDIRELFREWSSYVEKCDAIYVKAPGRNKNVFFSGESPLLKKGFSYMISGSEWMEKAFLGVEGKVCSIPFTTRRPTFKEVRRVHGMLSFIRFHEDFGDFASGREIKQEKAIQRLEDLDARVQAVTASKEADTSVTADCAASQLSTYPEDSGNSALQTGDGVTSTDTGSLQEKVEISPRERISETADDVSPTSHEDLVSACKSGSIKSTEETLDELWQQASGSPSSERDSWNAALLSEHIGKQGETCLHIAAQCGHTSLVAFLLSAGSDPTIRDKVGRLPYNVARDKPTRNAFRRFMAQCPDKYDYSSAQVPGPLTDEMEKHKEKKKQEKRKLQQKAKKEKLKEEKEQKKKKTEEEEKIKQWEALSDREKRALAAERRIAESKAAKPTQTTSREPFISSTCSLCQASLRGLTPFSRLQCSYCSMKCLKDHREKLK
eukprot:m.155117 g.155117  ORF g.155117 m.155117 type:complete len:673 (+) comp38658_c0_seq8:12-2030(+)